MTRGPKKHLKRIAAPSHWMLSKLSGMWAPKPSQGPHKQQECLPLCIILRERLKYALTRRECQMICKQKLVQVDGRVRTDINFPTGLMDIISINKSNDCFRLVFDTRGRYILHDLTSSPEEKRFKLCKVVRQETTKRGIPIIVTHDARTIRYPPLEAKVLDTVKVNIESGKVEDVAKFELGSTVMVTKGRNCGRIGTLTGRDAHPGSFDVVHVRDAEGQEFATRLSNIFVIGKNGAEEAMISLPRGRGIKKDLFASRARLMKHNAQQGRSQ
jgi:small subunit ribosomal protein S4e